MMKRSGGGVGVVWCGDRIRVAVDESALEDLEGEKTFRLSQVSMAHAM
jgi:hypothetical protein